MKRILTVIFTLVTASFVLYSCVKVYTREDFDKMKDRTFYLLPVESVFMVPDSIEIWKKIEVNIGDSVVKGVKEMDPVRIKDSLEKRYGITVDISLFEKARTDEKESQRYFRALKDANSTGSSSFSGILTPGYNGYKDSDLYLEVDNIRKTKSHIVIGHSTIVEGNNIKTSIIIKITAIDGDSKGEVKLGRTFIISTQGSSGFTGTDAVDYGRIYKSLSDFTGYRYNDFNNWSYSEASCPYLDGSM